MSVNPPTVCEGDFFAMSMDPMAPPTVSEGRCGLIPRPCSKNSGSESGTLRAGSADSASHENRLQSSPEIAGYNFFLLHTLVFSPLSLAGFQECA